MVQHSRDDSKYYLIISIILLCSFLSYEIHLYDYYMVFTAVISLLLIGIIALFFLYENNLTSDMIQSCTNNFGIIVLFFGMIIITAIDNLIYDINKDSSVFYVIMMFLCLFSSFFVLPLILVKNKKLFDYSVDLISVLGCILACAAIFIYYFPGILPYSLESGRARAIYFDPNYCAMVLGIVAMLNVNRGKILKSIFIIVLCCYAIFLTGSRGTVISLIVSVSLYVLFIEKNKIFNKCLILIIICLCSIFIIKYLRSIDFFREGQGTNGRDKLIGLAIEGLKESPIWGYGYQSISTYLIEIRHAANASTHNTFVDYAFSFGLVALIDYLFIILRSVFRGIRNQCPIYLILPLIFMLINMNSIVYSFGGVGIGSLLFTILLGVVNRSKFEV